MIWIDFPRLKEEFPVLKGLSNEKIDKWLLDEVSYIGNQQHNLINSRNSDFFTLEESKLVFRPKNWVRSGIIEIFSPSRPSNKIGVLDIKGLGHGEPSQNQVIKTKKYFNTLISGQDQKKIDKLRIKSHSDGLMSLGEAVTEYLRDRAISRLMESQGIKEGTTKGQAIVAMPFTIIKEFNREIPAAIYIRTPSTIRRIGGNKIPNHIYTDPQGGKQVDEFGRSVDFGGALINDKRLKHLFGVINNGNKFDSQMRIDWARAHEAALSWKLGNKKAISNYIQWAISEIESNIKLPKITNKNELKIATNLAKKRNIEKKINIRKFQNKISKNWDNPYKVRTELLRLKNSTNDIMPLLRPFIDAKKLSNDGKISWMNNRLIRKAVVSVLISRSNQKEFYIELSEFINDPDESIRSIAKKEYLFGNNPYSEHLITHLRKLGHPLQIDQISSAKSCNNILKELI